MREINSNADVDASSHCFTEGSTIRLIFLRCIPVWYTRPHFRPRIFHSTCLLLKRMVHLQCAAALNRFMFELELLDLSSDRDRLPAALFVFSEATVDTFLYLHPDGVPSFSHSTIIFSGVCLS